MTEEDTAVDSKSKQDWNLHINCMFPDTKMKHAKKRTLCLLCNIMFWSCFAASGAGCHEPVNLKTISAFWSKMCCPL